jgi:hypothetical protein
MTNEEALRKACIEWLLADSAVMTKSQRGALARLTMAERKLRLAIVRNYGNPT